MKKFLILIVTLMLFASCMPMQISLHEKRYWRFQKKTRGYYYRTYPFYQQKRIKGKAYIPYFRAGKF